MAALLEEEQKIHQHPNAYIQPRWKQFNVPVLCYIDKNDKCKETIDVLGSLRLKQYAVDIIHDEYNEDEDEIEDWLWYLFWNKKYKNLATEFGDATAAQQVDFYFKFKQQVINDVEAAYIASKKLKNCD